VNCEHVERRGRDLIQDAARSMLKRMCLTKHLKSGNYSLDPNVSNCRAANHQRGLAACAEFGGRGNKK